MNLYFMRHGIALPSDDLSAGADRDRPLSPKGMKRLSKAAKGMSRLGISFDVLLTSPLARARQTADIVAGAMDSEAPVEELSSLAPESSLEQLMLDLNRYQDRGDLLLVGHEPSLSHVLSHLLGGKAGRSLHVEFKKGALCRIEIDALPATSPGNLHWLLTPKQLRLLGARRAKARRNHG